MFGWAGSTGGSGAAVSVGCREAVHSHADAERAERLGRERDRLLADEAQARRLVLATVDQVEGDACAEAGGGHSEARGARGV